MLRVCPDAGATPASGPAESLYLKLRSVGLDKSRVYKIRSGALDRASIHLSFDDGTIAFTEDAGGRITGALFLGDGDILLSPPNPAERSSLALFTGAAILEEKFSMAYLRFNDDVLEALRPNLRPPISPASHCRRARASGCPPTSTCSPNGIGPTT